MTSDGFLFAGNRSMFRDQWENNERRFVKKTLSKMDLFINFGANHGYYCCLALDAGVRTIAFEPIPENCAMIAKNIKKNGWEDDFALHPVAVSNSTGIAEMYGLSRTDASLIKGFSKTAHLKSQSVPIHRVDDVIPPHIYRNKNALVLMDIEGSEAKALEGARSLLDTCPKPVWIIEIFPHAVYSERNPAHQAFETMIDAGYSAYVLNDNLGLDRITQESLVFSHDRRGAKTSFSGGNVVFCHRDFRV